jgi:hypothetical protein
MVYFRASDILLASRSFRGQEPASHKRSSKTLGPIKRFEQQVDNDE